MKFSWPKFPRLVWGDPLGPFKPLGNPALTPSPAASSSTLLMAPGASNNPYAHVVSVEEGYLFFDNYRNVRLTLSVPNTNAGLSAVQKNYQPGCMIEHGGRAMIVTEVSVSSAAQMDRPGEMEVQVEAISTLTLLQRAAHVPSIAPLSQALKVLNARKPSTGRKILFV